jgi:hypothetical protein
MQQNDYALALSAGLASPYGEHVAFMARRLQLWRRGSLRSRKPWASGSMVALRGTGIVRVPISAAASELKLVLPGRYAGAGLLFG